MAEISKTGSQVNRPSAPNGPEEGPIVPGNPDGVNLEEARERFLNAAKLSKDERTAPQPSGELGSDAGPGAPEERAGRKSEHRHLPAPIPADETPAVPDETAQATLQGTGTPSAPEVTRETGGPSPTPRRAGALDADRRAQAHVPVPAPAAASTVRASVLPTASEQMADLVRDSGVPIQPEATFPDADARSGLQSNPRKTSAVDPEAKKKGSAEDNRDEVPVLEGDRVLYGLQAPTGDVQGPASPAEVAQSDLSEIVQKLADRILVSEPQAGQPEVRIKLNMETLEGTEVSLKRDAQGLTVAFDAPSLAVAQRLDEAVPHLQRVLESHQVEKHHGEPVRIEVNMESDQSDMNQSGDGRSRNRRDLRDELADQD